MGTHLARYTAVLNLVGGAAIGTVPWHSVVLKLGNFLAKSTLPIIIANQYQHGLCKFDHLFESILKQISRDRRSIEARIHGHGWMPWYRSLTYRKNSSRGLLLHLVMVPRGSGTRRASPIEDTRTPRCPSIAGGPQKGHRTAAHAGPRAALAWCTLTITAKAAARGAACSVHNWVYSQFARGHGPLRALWPQAAAHCARAGGRGVLVLGRHGGHEGGRGRLGLGVRAHCNATMRHCTKMRDITKLHCRFALPRIRFIPGSLR